MRVNDQMDKFTFLKGVGREQLVNRAGAVLGLHVDLVQQLCQPIDSADRQQFDCWCIERISSEP